MSKLPNSHTKIYFETAVGILPDAVQQLGQVCSHNLANLLLYQRSILKIYAKKFDFWWTKRSYGSSILMAVDQKVCVFSAILLIRRFFGYQILDSIEL